MTTPLSAETLEARWQNGEVCILPVCESRVFLHWPTGAEAGPRLLAPVREQAEELLAHADTPAWVGAFDGRDCFAVRLERFEPESRIPGGDFADLREVAGLLSDPEWSLLARAKAMVHWHETHAYCGCCGQRSEREAAGLSRRCVNPDCRRRHFPRTDPAVIMRLCHGDRILLARQPAWPEKRRSVLAGFVSPGETAEAAVEREAFEEAGLRVMPDSIRYLDSQPWPFPGSLMLAFTARCENADIQRHDGELAVAEWWSREALRAASRDGRIQLPGRRSVARHLIEDWLEQGPR